MAIKLKRKDGTVTQYRNSEYIPLFYMFPKDMLEKAGKEFLNLPRYPALMYVDWKVIEFIESDAFINFIIDATAYIVWTYMNTGAKREIYSGYEPSWRFAHAPQYWLKALIDEGVILSSDALYKLCKEKPDKKYRYASWSDVSICLNYVVPNAIKEFGMDKIIDVAKEYRCFEDFDYRDSNQKTDFLRKWYHTRTKHSQISWERYKEMYVENNDGQELDITDSGSNMEETVLSQVQIEDFVSQLSEKDKKILELRFEGRTLNEIADKLGYKNHSGVQKRIKKIGEAYEEYANVDYGFSEIV